MNYWKCDKCSSCAEGLGGAAGLRAIGWTFERAKDGKAARLLCPLHREKTGPCRKDPGQQCRFCPSEDQAETIQGYMEAFWDSEGG